MNLKREADKAGENGKKSSLTGGGTNWSGSCVRAVLQAVRQTGPQSVLIV